MTPERRRFLEPLLDAALALRPAELSSYLDAVCRGDSALRAELDSLISASLISDGEQTGTLFGRRGADFFPSVVAEPDELSSPGRVLGGQYVIERELGRGGMATVYLAQDRKHGRQVAVKVLHSALAAVVGADRFLQEIRLTARLHHPHVLGLIDSGVIRPNADSDSGASESRTGRPYYVMPYVAGESLRDRLRREGPLSVAEAVRIAKEVAGALEYAHRHGIVHRDIKPENILLGEGGEVLVADFGIALALRNAGGEQFGERMTHTGVLLGTPQYMAPEQAMGERTIDARTDVYALGSVLYAMLAGGPPFTGPTPHTIVARVLTEAPPPLAALRPSVPATVDAAVRTALQKLPADRFASAADFAAAIDSATPSAGDVSAGTRTAPRDATARQRLVAAGLLAAGLFAVGVFVAGLMLGRAGRPPAAAPRGPVRFVIEPESGYSGGDPPAIAPDGRTVVYPQNAFEGARLFARRLDDLAAHPLPGTEEARSPFFSPDGRWVAFRAGSEIRKVPLDGGSPVAVASTARTGYSAGAWGDDGSIYFTGGRKNGDLYRVPARGGVPTRVLAADSAAPLASIRVLPGARAALVTVVPNGEVSQIGVVDLASGRLHRLGPGTGASYAAGYLVYADAAGQLFRQPFDSNRLVPVGEAEAIVGRVQVWPVSRRGAHFDVARSGDIVYRVSFTESTTLSLLDRAGNTVRGIGGRGIWAPRLSPDGRRVVYAAFAPGQYRSDLWVAELASGTAQRVTADANENNDPQWSPDGGAVTYSADAPGGKDLYVRSLRSDSARLLLRRPGVQFTSDWSRVGRALLFTDVPDAGGFDVWVQPADGGPARPYLATPASELGARMSPDGRWVAYTSFETGRGEVYVQSYPTPRRARLVSEGGGSEPVWGADGGELYYWHGDQLVAARLGPGASDEPPVVRGRTPLFRATYLHALQPNYDVSPDGNRFVVVTTDPLATKIVIALDVLDGAQRRARSSR